MFTVVAFCCCEISERNGIAGNAANVSRMKTNQVLIIIGCLRTALAARAWEDISYGGRRSADGTELQLEVGPNTTLDALINIFAFKVHKVTLLSSFVLRHQRHRTMLHRKNLLMNVMCDLEIPSMQSPSSLCILALKQNWSLEPMFISFRRISGRCCFSVKTGYGLPFFVFIFMFCQVISRPLDLIWFGLAVFLVLVVILWMRHFGLHMDDTGTGELIFHRGASFSRAVRGSSWVAVRRSKVGSDQMVPGSFRFSYQPCSGHCWLRWISKDCGGQVPGSWVGWVAVWAGWAGWAVVRQYVLVKRHTKAHDLSLPSSHASLMTARIVSASDICNWWSLSNFLLYTTLALSIVGMSASFVWCSQRKLL